MAHREVAPEQPHALHQLHRRHAMLAQRLVELDDVVGGVGDDGHSELVGRLARGAQEVEAARLHLPGREEAANAPARAAVDSLDEGQRALELLLAGRLVQGALEAAALVAHPAAGVIARAEIGANAETLHLAEERLLHPELAAELHEGRDAVAQHLGHREGGEEAIAGVRIGVRGPRVPRIAAHSRALAGHGDLQEGLTVEVRPAGIGDEAVGSAVPGMHVRVDEAGRHQSATGVDLGVDRALEAPTDMQDAVVLVHDHAVGDERVGVACEAHDPPAADECSHRQVRRALDIRRSSLCDRGRTRRRGHRARALIQPSSRLRASPFSSNRNPLPRRGRGMRTMR